MEYQRKLPKRFFVIERNPEEIVTIKRLTKRDNYWLNIKLNHALTLSYNQYFNQWRLWSFAINKQPTYVELTDNEFTTLRNMVILICGFRAHFGAPNGALKSRNVVYINKRDLKEAAKALTMFNRAIRMQKNVKRYKREFHDVNNNFIPEKYRVTDNNDAILG